MRRGLVDEGVHAGVVVAVWEASERERFVEARTSHPFGDPSDPGAKKEM